MCFRCRRTALHLASLNGHTELAVALVRAGADVHCKAANGYGSSGWILMSLGCHSAGADGPATRVWGCRSGRFCCAGGRRCTRRRRTATRRRRWRCSRPARTCTARPTTGTVLEAACSCRWVADSAGAAGPSTRVWRCRSGWFGCAGGRRCTRHRSTATRRRRWRFTRRARTCTARTPTGTVPWAACSCRWVATVWGGRPVDSGLGLQEWLFWLCRWTVLHYASQNGHAETAMALVRAGADVHCTENDGYGSRTASW
jgi:hypothetical protein